MSFSFSSFFTMVFEIDEHIPGGRRLQSIEVDIMLWSTWPLSNKLNNLCQNQYHFHSSWTRCCLALRLEKSFSHCASSRNAWSLFRLLNSLNERHTIAKRQRWVVCSSNSSSNLSGLQIQPIWNAVGPATYAPRSHPTYVCACHIISKTCTAIGAMQGTAPWTIACRPCKRARGLKMCFWEDDWWQLYTRIMCFPSINGRQ